MGPEWADQKTRKAKEAQLIEAHRAISYNVTLDNNKKGENNPFYGKFHTPETKKRIGDAMRGVPNTKLGLEVSINGVIYPSLADAHRKLDLCRKTVRNRLNSSQWPHWFYVSDPS
jgi:hypothetical protein